MTAQDLGLVRQVRVVLIVVGDFSLKGVQLLIPLEHLLLSDVLLDFAPELCLLLLEDPDIVLNDLGVYPILDLHALEYVLRLLGAHVEDV